MERILARMALHIGHRLLRRDDRVADGAFCLAFQRADYIAAESGKTVYD